MHVQSMAAALRAQAQEIERLRMDLQRTSIKQKENILELTAGALEEFVQEDRLAQWMRLCVRALKEFLDKEGGTLQRPLDHEGAHDGADAPPTPVIMCWRIESGNCSVSRTWRTRCIMLPGLAKSVKGGGSQGRPGQ